MTARKTNRRDMHKVAIQAFHARNRPDTEHTDDPPDKHQLQAQLAIQSELVTTLRKDSLARRVAHSVIELFPSVKPELDGETVVASRTAVACRLARELLSSKERGHTGAINLGMRQANAALQKADHYLKSYRSLALDKVNSDSSTITHA